MDINLLALNVGNSRVSIGVFEAGELVYSTRVPHAQRDEWGARIGEAWERIKDADQPGVAGASVNPPLIEPLEHAVMQVTGEKVQWIGRDIDLPIKVLTDEPDKTGIDRILNVAAAYEQMEKACVVVDAGTAITINCCNDQGEFLGGAIAPGAVTQLQALHEKTAKLPQAPLAAPTAAYGKTTESAIQQGVFYGIRGLVKEVTENFATELGTWPDIIATGGDAKVLFDGWELIHAISPDLTLYGIALAYTNHHIKHGT
jgi:type III pantothenate kinase